MSHTVCITTHEYPPDFGGVGISAHRVAHMLYKMGLRIHVAVFGSYSKERRLSSNSCFRRPSVETINDDEVIVHRIYGAIRSTHPKIQDYACDIYLELRRLHTIYHFDAIHSFFITKTGLISMILAKEGGIPLISSIRGADLHKHLFNPTIFSLIQSIFEASAWITFVSKDLQKRAKYLFPSANRKSSIFWNSIDCSSLPTLMNLTKSFGSNVVVIGTIGRMRDKKGLEYLIDACKTLLKNHNIRLLIIGD